MPALPSITGSGLDIPGLVSSLVNASRAPTANRLNAAGGAVKARLSAIGQIKNSLTSLQSALETLNKHTSGAARTVNLPKHAGISASAAASAVPGRYQVEVVQLASAHKLVSGSGHAQGQTFGAGRLSIAVGQGEQQQTREIDVKDGATLADIASAINDAFAGSGVSASVVSADDGEHLVVSSTHTGSANAIAVTATGDAQLQALADTMQGKLPAQDAIVRVDGLQRTASSNTLSDLIPGVTLNLNIAAPGEPFDLEIAIDHAALKADLEAFASAWNAAGSLLKTSSAYDPATRSAAVLTGDSLVRTLQQQLRDEVSGNVSELRALGLTLDKDGGMKFDPATFDAAIKTDPNALAAVFGREGKYAAALEQMLKHTLNSSDGSLTLRSKTLDKQVKDYGKQLDQLDLRMDKLTALYTAQFTAMETMITQMQGSANALGQLLASSNA